MGAANEEMGRVHLRTHFSVMWQSFEWPTFVYNEIK